TSLQISVLPVSVEFLPKVERRLGMMNTAVSAAETRPIETPWTRVGLFEIVRRFVRTISVAPNPKHVKEVAELAMTTSQTAIPNMTPKAGAERQFSRSSFLRFHASRKHHRDPKPQSMEIIPSSFLLVVIPMMVGAASNPPGVVPISGNASMKRTDN